MVVALVALTSGYYVYTGTQAAGDEDASEALQTATVRRGTIIVSATGAGTIVPAGQVALSFPSNGILSELLVQVGDRVRAGDLLARIEPASAQKALTSAELQLAQARMQTEAAATETGVSYDDLSIAQAEMALTDAAKALDELRNWQPDVEKIALAQAQLEAATANYSAAVAQQSSAYYGAETARISVEQAQRDVADAQSAYDQAFEPARDWELGDPRLGPKLEAERNAAARNLQRAQDNLAIAEANYNKAVASSASGGPASAQSSILSAEQALAGAQNGPAPEEIAAAEKAVERATLSLQQAQLNREAHLLSLAQAELAVAEAEAALERTTLVAPVDGTVTAVNASAGESINGTVIVLADLNQPLLEVFLDETNLDKVGVGYQVDVVFDALPEETFSGRVVRVDPQLHKESGVSAVRALVEVDYDKPQPLPVGLNATVDVIGGRAENTLVVPVEAVREISPGQYALFVIVDGEPQLRMVEVGLMDFTFAEIIAGVEAGDVVTTGIVQTQ
ncbi:MAG: HlyD family efflux transporter periplasmic adaptor subunit [Anaerolineae bacterium]|nr:HlyD family efflux transporter periplasmic adaptor subunit [Anaerolineae bacterium]